MKCQIGGDISKWAVLIISPEPWRAHTVSKHHYAMMLARQGANVFFLDPPDESFDDVRINRIDGHERLHVVQGPKIKSGLRFYPAFVRRWVERAWLKDLEKKIGVSLSVIWLFENSRFFDMGFADERLKIYHQVDLNQNFNPKTAAITADICFCTSDLIREKLLSYTPCVYKIHHGVVPAQNLQPLSTSQVQNVARAVPLAVYIGNLDMEYLDAPLLAETVKSFPDVQFHFVGGYTKGGKLWKAASAYSNVVWWGKLDSRLISPILERADILLVTYEERHWKDQSSPHKFMEYFASGKTVISTYTDEYKDKRHLLKMVDDSNDFIPAFEEVVNHLEEYNSPERQAERIAFAKENTYDRQLDRIFKLLKQHRLIAVDQKEY